MSSARRQPNADNGPRFIVNIKIMGGEMIHIENMSSNTTVYALKIAIHHIINEPVKKIVLTIMDNSAQGFTTLNDNMPLSQYGINSDDNELNLVVIPPKYNPTDSEKFLEADLPLLKYLEIVPPNANVVQTLTSDMEGKILYIVSERYTTHAVKCKIHMVTPQTVELNITKHNFLLEFDLTAGYFPKLLNNNRVYLLEDSNAAQGGRRRKHSHRTKRRILKNRSNCRSNCRSNRRKH